MLSTTLGEQEEPQETLTLVIEARVTALGPLTLTTTTTNRIRHTALPAPLAALPAPPPLAATTAGMGTSLPGRPARDAPQTVKNAPTAPPAASATPGTLSTPPPVPVKHVEPTAPSASTSSPAQAVIFSTD